MSQTANKTAGKYTVVDSREVANKIIKKLTSKENFSFFKDFKNKDCKKPTDFVQECLLSGEEIISVIAKAKTIFIDQPMLVEVRLPVIIFGDIHGQFRDLLLILECLEKPPKMNFLFLGDYVDRGVYSLECLSLLLSYKIKYPEQVYLLRGNHESARATRNYGLYEECKVRFENHRLWQQFMKLFNVMPVAAALLAKKKILCMHGGISKKLVRLSDIEKIQRPTDIPRKGLLADLLWADPDKKFLGWNSNTHRGISYTFGADVVRAFAKKHKLACIVRAHQVVQKGYEFFAGRKLCTIFSALNYCGVFKNDAACMKVEHPLKVTMYHFPYLQKNNPNITERYRTKKIRLYKRTKLTPT